MDIRFILSFDTTIASIIATHVWEFGEDPNEVFSVMDNFEPDIVLEVGENELSFLLAKSPIKVNTANHTYDVWLAGVNQDKQKKLFITNDELLTLLERDMKNWEIEKSPLPEVSKSIAH